MIRPGDSRKPLVMCLGASVELSTLTAKQGAFTRAGGVRRGIQSYSRMSVGSGRFSKLSREVSGMSGRSIGTSERAAQLGHLELRGRPQHPGGLDRSARSAREREFQRSTKGA